MIGRRVAVAVAALAVMAPTVLVAGCAGPADGSGQAAAGSSAAEAADAGSLAPARPTSQLPTVGVAQLPTEGRQTLVLIRDGGPFPYDKDGSTFGNREGVLPKAPSGHYREYTVASPGSPDRGARRIVAGRNGSRFYTADHYSTFREVVSQ